MSFFACPGSSFRQQCLQSVHGLYPASGERLTPLDQDPQRLEVPIDLQHPQARGADRDHRDRVCVVGVCLAVVTGVEQPDSGGQLRGNVDDLLAGLQEPLRQGASDTVGALDRPYPRRPCLGVGPHCRVAGPVGGEPPRAELPFAVVDDLDRRRQLVGIDPDDDTLHVLLPPELLPMWTARWAVLLRAEQSLLEPRLVTAPGGQQSESEPHRRSWWAAQ